jgi:predicted 2-oxoglutarate/Fe(II)-dependent dioxygenase YbiX
MTARFRALIPSVLTREECAEAIASAEACGFEAMGARYPGDYRNNDRALLDDAALAGRLFERLRPHLPQLWDEDGARWRLEGLNTRFRFCRYRGGQQFVKHRDGAWARTKTERSWLTVMLYLNDAGEFVGGATRFYEGAQPEAVAPREGQAIVFDHRLWHDGAAVSAGVKYVMRTDVMYRLEQAGSSVARQTRGGLEREQVHTGHAGYVWVVRKLADGRLVSGSRDCTVRCWGEGAIVREGLAGSATAVVEVGEALWVGGRHGRIDDGRRSWQAHEGVVLGLERMGDGSVISCGADGAIRRWSAAGEALGEVARHAGWVWGVAVDGAKVLAAVEPISAIAIGAKGDRLGVIALDGGGSWQAHEGAVTALAALGGGRWVSGGEDCAVRVWSSAGGLLGEGAHGDFVRSVAVLDAGRFATASYDGTVAVWRVSGSGGALRQSPAADH